MMMTQGREEHSSLAMRGVPKQSLKTALREGKYEDAGWRVRKDGSLVRLDPGNFSMAAVDCPQRV
jgi:hypothetical protein